MTDYCFHLDRIAGNFSITKNGELLGEGNQALSFSTYAFQFQDVSANEYEMMAKGFFCWRRMQLFKNGSLAGSYTRTKAVDTGVEFGRRDFIRRNGEYLHHIDRCWRKSEFGMCLYSWSGTPSDIEIEVISLVIMSFIQSKQGFSVTAMP